MRLPRTVQPQDPSAKAGSGIGQSAGKFFGGMASFYGGILKGATNRIREGKSGGAGSSGSRSSDSDIIDFG
jgi:hypothetical protein